MPGAWGGLLHCSKAPLVLTLEWNYIMMKALSFLD